MRVIFMGTPDFSVGTLEAIIEAGHEVALVVTQPDKPKGRGKTMQYTFLFDSVFTWVIVVPVAFVLAKYTALGIVAVYFLVQATELIKVVIGYFMVKSDVWLVQMV